MIPAWAVKLIADAQLPNCRFVPFDGMARWQIVRWAVKTSLRAAKAKSIMDAIASGSIPLDDRSAGDKTPGHG
jgi:hypothetical protein